MASKLVIREDGTARLDDVRLSYPHLWTPWAGEGDDGKPGKPKYSMKGLINLADSKPTVVQLRNYIVAFAAKEGPKDSKGGACVLPADRLCLRNGSGSGKPEQEGHWTMALSETSRPQIIGRKREVLAEADGVIYAGCYVNVLFRLWFQDNKFGKRVNANLLTVQFARDGDAFSETGPRPDVNEAFEEVGEEGAVAGDGLGDDDI